MNLYLLTVVHIENRLLLCGLFSDRFDTLLVLLVLSLFYLFLQILGYYVMIFQLLGIVNIVYFLFAVRFWLLNFVLLVLLFLLFRQIYRLFLFVFLILPTSSNWYTVFDGEKIVFSFEIKSFKLL